MRKDIKGSRTESAKLGIKGERGRVGLGGRQAGRKTQEENGESEALTLTLSLSPLLCRPLRGPVDNWAWDSWQSLRVKSR